MSTTNEVSKFAIVKKIMAILKLDEAGKINRFFEKELQSFKNQIRDLNNYISALTNKYEADLDKLKDAIEDAKENVAAAYQSVTLENVVNNEAMQAFSSIYWNKVDTAEAAVKRLEESMKKLTEKYDEEVKAKKEAIAKIEERIAIITK